MYMKMQSLNMGGRHTFDTIFRDHMQDVIIRTFTVFLLPEYDITVVTGDKRFAGTDAKVCLTMYGKRGTSKRIALRNKSKNNFERGQKDRFSSGIMEDIGPLTRIK